MNHSSTPSLAPTLTRLGIGERQRLVSLAEAEARAMNQAEAGALLALPAEVRAALAALVRDGAVTLYVKGPDGFGEPVSDRCIWRHGRAAQPATFVRPALPRPSMFAPSRPFLSACPEGFDAVPGMPAVRELCGVRGAAEILEGGPELAGLVPYLVQRLAVDEAAVDAMRARLAETLRGGGTAAVQGDRRRLAAAMLKSMGKVKGARKIVGARFGVNERTIGKWLDEIKAEDLSQSRAGAFGAMASTLRRA